jgi:hypothetical protein
VPPQEHDDKHDDHNQDDRSEADKHGFLLPYTAGLVWSVPEGVLDLRPGLLGIALELVTVAFGAQPPVAGQPAGGLLTGLPEPSPCRAAAAGRAARAGQQQARG